MADSGEIQLWAIISGWVLTILAGIFGYGKLNERVSTHDKQLSDLKKANLMSIPEHREFCMNNTASITGRIETMCQKIDVWHTEDRQGQQELNKRVKAIEESMIAITTELRVRNENRT